MTEDHRERAAFEAWWKTGLSPDEYDLTAMLGKRGIEYSEPLIQNAWAGWEARAAIIPEGYARLADMLGKAATALESRSLHEFRREQFLRCSICETPADDELGPQHTPECFISECRAMIAASPQGETK